MKAKKGSTKGAGKKRYPSPKMVRGVERRKEKKSKKR